MPNFNGDVVFIDTSGQVRAQSGDLTLRADSTNTRSIIVGSGASLRPDRDVSMDLGTPSLRWHALNAGYVEAASGRIGMNFDSNGPFFQWGDTGFIMTGNGSNTLFLNDVELISIVSKFNLGAGTTLTVDGETSLQGAFELSAPGEFTVLYPFFDDAGELGKPELRINRISAVSGLYNILSAPTSGTFIGFESSLVPLRDAIYSLGTSSRRWENVYSVSGSIASLSVTALAAPFATLGDITVGSANFVGPGLVTLGGGTLFTNASAPLPDATVPFGLTNLRFGTMHMISGFMDAITPSVIGTSTDMVGSFLPDIASTRSLGTSTREWMSIYANSGIFDFVETRIINVLNELYATSTFIDGTLTFVNPGLEIVSESLSWNLLASQVTFTNGGVVFDVPTNTTEFASYRPKINNNIDLVTRKEAITVVHGLVTANSGAIINNSGERDIYNYTVPANTLQPSGRLKLELAGSFTNMAGEKVNFTPRVYINGTAIWGDVLAVAQGPRPADFQMQVMIDSLGHVNSQRVHGQLLLATRAAGSVTGNGDFSATYAGGPWSSDVTSGTVSFAQPVNIRVSMQLGTASTNASYSGFHAMMTHYPWPGI